MKKIFCLFIPILICLCGCTTQFKDDVSSALPSGLTVLTDTKPTTSVTDTPLNTTDSVEKPSSSESEVTNKTKPSRVISNLKGVNITYSEIEADNTQLSNQVKSGNVVEITYKVNTTPPSSHKTTATRIVKDAAADYCLKLLNEMPETKEICENISFSPDDKDAYWIKHESGQWRIDIYEHKAQDEKTQFDYKIYKLQNLTDTENNIGTGVVLKMPDNLIKEFKDLWKFPYTIWDGWIKDGAVEFKKTYATESNLSSRITKILLNQSNNQMDESKIVLELTSKIDQEVKIDLYSEHGCQVFSGDRDVKVFLKANQPKSVELSFTGIDKVCGSDLSIYANDNKHKIIIWP